MRTKKEEKSVKIPTHIKVILIMTIIVCGLSGIKYLVQASESEPVNAELEPINLNYTKNEKIDVHSILNQNQEEQIAQSIETQEMDLEYITKYKNNPELPKGMLQVIQEGRNGVQQAIIKKTYANGELIKEEQIGSKVTKSNIEKIIEVGTADYKSNYKVKVGDTLYVTANTLILRREPDIHSDSITMLNQKEEVKLLAINSEWYKIQQNNFIGWVNQYCVTYINPNKPYQEEQAKGEQKSKAQLLATLSKDMKLNKPSGLSLEQFKKIFEKESQDTKGIFRDNAQYFYYIEKQYNINGVFVAAMAIHESAWGTSKIANHKNNLFGYGAYDSNPYNSAYDFASYSEGIDLIARVLVKYYLNPAGTKLYEGEIATGKYYNGSTLQGVNKRYATDKNWANGVYKWMSYLYNKI